MAQGGGAGGGTVQAAAGEGDGNADGGGGNSMMRTMFQMMMMWTIMNVITSRFKPQQGNSTTGAGADGQVAKTRAGQMRNLFGTMEECDLFVYYAGGPNSSEPLPLELFTGNGSAIAEERGLEQIWHTKVWYEAKPEEQDINVTVGPFSDAVLEGHVDIARGPFLHAALVRSSQLEDLRNGSLPRAQVVLQMLPLIVKMKELNVDAGAENLLGVGGDGAAPATPSVAPNKSAVKRPYFKTKLEVRPVFDHTVQSMHTLAQRPFAKLRAYPRQEFYQPYLYLSDFWLLEKDFLALNQSLVGEKLPLSLSYNVITLWAWSLQTQMTEQWSAQSEWGVTDTQRDSFMVKRLVIDTNPYFLAFSVVFVIAHSLCTMLAFKSEIQFWRKNESMKGLSARTMCISFVCQMITSLYLLESQETSRLILFNIFLDTAVSFWKLRKAIKIEFKPRYPFVEFGGQTGYEASNTSEHDKTAIRYMSYILVPCFVIYSIRSLLVEKHRSWWSFIIGTLAGGVYMFGFIMMTPQLYINYKLKSVEHLPWRALTYKAMNTFIDDIFAFLIDMPVMHRMSCFRDDVIFFIYLYQRWIYRVDTSRPSIYTEGDDAQAAPVQDAHSSSTSAAVIDSAQPVAASSPQAAASSEAEEDRAAAGEHAASESALGQDSGAGRGDDGDEGLRQRR